MFAEKKHKWAIDTGDGALMGLPWPWTMGALDTAIYRTKKGATADLKFWRDKFSTASVVKVYVAYATVQPEQKGKS
ncbi:hypothetical protein LCGC14_2924040 [marine sediment metagenome]|uniref:Uncharacterized protein n=1 Tax=marine sediment metagenome TaxID=412755 RepID=A0A0F8XN36_9ZZZZ